MNKNIEDVKISKDLKEAVARLKSADPTKVIKNIQSAKQKRGYE